MHKIYPTEWIRLVDPSDRRNQFHLTALHEARAATDYRQPAAETPRRVPFLNRLRLALVGRAVPKTTQPCSCPA